MPRATVSTEPQVFELRTCPPDGFVKLRRMSYGELMSSQDMAYQISAKATQQSDEPDLDFNISRLAVELFQFQKCIVDHNLEDEHGHKLSFKTKDDLEKLDSNIGQEISSRITEIHNWNKNLPNSSEPSANGSSAEGATGVTVSPSSAPLTSGSASSLTSS